MADNIPESLRLLVAERAHGRCEYCQSPEAYGTERFSIEHILPRALGGLTTAENLALSCQGCNGHKSMKITAVDPETNEAVALFHPRQHRWQEHFAWSEEGLQILGITAIGRATIALLNMNRPSLANLRRALTAVNAHPASDET